MISMMREMRKIYKKSKFWKNLMLFCLSIFILLAGIIVLWLSSLKIPDFRSFEDRKVENSTKIYDRTGKILLFDIHKNTKRTDIAYQDMGVNIRNATVAIEDSQFYNHGGIKISSIVRAILSNIFGTGRTQGGSTITQQLVKNALLTREKSYTRKIKEWVLAIKIDKSMPKEKILEYYLNEAPYGGTIYGIEEASKIYFNKNARDLTLAEATYLASIPQSPTTLSPYGKNKDKLEARKNFVLSRMLEINFITKEDYDAAKKETVAFVPQTTTGIKAPHFVFFIKDYLEQKYGSEIVEKGGLKIITTLDYSLQEKGEQIVKEGALQNEKAWNGKNASLVAIDPKTGQILTMVGSRDYFDKEIEGNFNVTTASRQPGSSFKPFIYATAFNKGFLPDTTLFDLPTEFQTTCDAYGKAFPGHNQEDCYMPDNYDEKFRGPLSLRDALAQSINIPAVKLFYLTGLSDSLKTAEDLGISTLSDIGRYGLTLVIGGGEVSLLDMTSAYGIFANGGTRNPSTGILEVQDSAGKILEQYQPKPQNVLLKNTALVISNILSDEKARIPTFGARSVLYIPGKDVAVKTGTTNNNKDAWTIGYSPSIAVGVWAGNNDNTPMKKGGAAVAGPIWNKFMNEALKTLPEEKFEEPNTEIDPSLVKPILRGFWQGNENFFIDKISRKLAGPNTPKETTEEKVITNVHSILYWIDRNDILGPSPTDPSDNSQFNHWEIPIQDWWAQNSWKYGITTWSDKPSAIDDVHTDSAKPKISIIEPNTNTTYLPNQKINLKISSSGPYPLLKLDVFVNDEYLGTSQAPFIFSFTPKELENLQAENELKIISYDNIYNKSETNLTFKVQE
ncbi:PBP1A family penicillin-binding protein [Candidatus Nomurabacteria bacterium]|nr:PBP1A family penicillin-binding protein [Candidatus Nomurabacteria bacterium]